MYAAAPAFAASWLTFLSSFSCTSGRGSCAKMSFLVIHCTKREKIKIRPRSSSLQRHQPSMQTHQLTPKSKLQKFKCAEEQTYDVAHATWTSTHECTLSRSSARGRLCQQLSPSTREKATRCAMLRRHDRPNNTKFARSLLSQCVARLVHRR